MNSASRLSLRVRQHRELDMTLRKTGEIMAVDEKDNRHKIIKYTNFETVDTLGADTVVVEGSPIE